jgi:protein O-mannosyl-transferase
MKSRRPVAQKSLPSTPAAGPRLIISPLTTWVIAAVLTAGLFAIYSPALDFQFILDDHHFLNDPRLQSAGHVWEYFTSYAWAQIPGGPLSFYRPVFVLWLRLNFILAGMSAWGWHWLSIAKHSLVAVLLGLLAWKLLRDRVAALLAAVLFALHPAQTESVAWVTVPDPLVSAAALGSVLLYLAYRDRIHPEGPLHEAALKKKSRKHARKPGELPAIWLIASAVACMTALMAKETAIVLPVILFAMAVTAPSHADAGPQKAAAVAHRTASALRETLPFLCATVIYLALRFHALDGRLSSRTQHLPLKTVLLSWPATLWFYLKVLLWPVKSGAFGDPSLADRFSLRAVFFPGVGVSAAVAILIWGCVWAWRRARHDLPEGEALGVQRALLLGMLILVLPILLALNLNALDPGDFLHGRYTYLPLAGLALLAAAAWHLAARQQKLWLAAAGLVVVGFAVLTIQQEGMWKDDLTVFTVAHEIAPHNAPVAQNLVRTHVQAALALDEEDRCDEAMPVFNESIEKYPQDWFAWAGRGECLFKLNDLPGAEQSLRRAFELSREPRVKEEWEQVRSRMGLSSPMQ